MQFVRIENNRCRAYTTNQLRVMNYFVGYADSVHVEHTETLSKFKIQNQYSN